MGTQSKYQLRYSHNVIEHLGLKLYQNKPTNVLAELVSNSWDADAKNVWIDIQNDYVAVFDDGIGMSSHELIDNYLIIAKKKRNAKTISQHTPADRKMMGRKGIGKLAAFGIANKVSLVTIDKENSSCCWMEFDLTEMLGNDSLNTHEYEYIPNIICDEVNIDEIPCDKDPTGTVSKFLGKIQKNGTLILMDKLSLKKVISEDQLTQSIGQRFTVTLLREDFSVLINDKKVTQKHALPDFPFRIPDKEGVVTETLNINGVDREVSYWVGFIEKADWPQDQAGVGVYAHGKIAQDRPFVFGLKGREITTRYMYGVIEADWLDELEEDVISTDRTNVNWQNDDTSELHEWGHKIVSEWVVKYRKYQKNGKEDKVLKKISTLPNIPKVTSQEKEIIKDMVCNMSPQVYRDEQLQDEVIEKLTSAWTHKPSRNIIKSLWDQLKFSETNEQQFIKLLHDIHDHLVPESLSLSVTVAQKIYALTKLYELSINGTERQLQVLLESFPWILGTEMGKVYANLQLKTLAKQAALEGLLPSHGSTENDLEEFADLPDSQTRPDFAFFNDQNNSQFFVVELKNPQIPLEYKHLSQLNTYCYWIKTKYPKAIVKGYLIGTNPGGIDTKDPEYEIVTWTDICLRSRKDYLELLASMLNGIGEHYGDARVDAVMEFGGDSTRELLQRMAQADSPLNEYFEELDNKLNK